MTVLPAPPPIFLLSCYRSGSTLLRMILDTHPEIYAPPELLTGALARSLAHFYASQKGLLFERADHDQPPFPEIFRKVRQILKESLDATTRERGKLTWCEKSPGNLSFPMLYERLFPEARLICLYRHSRDFLSSQTDFGANALTPELLALLSRHQGNRVRAFLDYWNDRVQAMLDLERRHPERCFRIRYEDLVREPEKIVPPLLEFLGVSPQNDLHERVFTVQHDHGFGDPNVAFTRQIHRNKIGAGAGLALDGADPEAVALQERLLGELGYPQVLAAEPEADTARPDGLAALPLRELFEQRMAERLRENPEVARQLGTFRFILEGDEGGSWRLRDGRIEPLAGAGQPAEPAAASVRLATGDFRELLSGRVSPGQLVRAGRLKVTGVANSSLLYLAKLL